MQEICYGQNICVFSKVLSWSPNSSVVVFQNGAFKEEIKVNEIIIVGSDLTGLVSL